MLTEGLLEGEEDGRLERLGESEGSLDGSSDIVGDAEGSKDGTLLGLALG